LRRLSEPTFRRCQFGGIVVAGEKMAVAIGRHLNQDENQQKNGPEDAHCELWIAVDPAHETVPRVG